MRERLQLELTPSEYAEARAAERARTLAQLQRELETARNSRAEWYVWIRDSYPLMKCGK